jgi:hypothetical protein
MPFLYNGSDLRDSYITQSDIDNLLSAAASTLFSCGENFYGQLGLGDIVKRSSPVQVGSLMTWNKIAGGYHTVATKTDGSLWTWGYNGSGQLGLGDIVKRSSPVQVGSLLTWNNVASGQTHTVATMKS